MVGSEGSTGVEDPWRGHLSSTVVMRVGFMVSITPSFTSMVSHAKAVIHVVVYLVYNSHMHCCPVVCSLSNSQGSLTDRSHHWERMTEN